MITKFFSFLFPITKNIKSDYNGNLEVTVINGKKYLDTLNTNYSYGSLQRVMQFSLKQLDLSRIHNALVLGLGGGCAVKLLRQDFHYSGAITAVDIDPVIINLAEKEFHIVSDESTKIICADAFTFVEKDNSKFDLVIIDLFIDNKVPDKFLTLEFWRYLLAHISTGGKIIFNTLCDPFTNLEPIEEKLKRRGFEFKTHRYVENTNKVLITRNRNKGLAPIGNPSQ
jgi:spermidine synthase